MNDEEVLAALRTETRAAVRARYANALRDGASALKYRADRLRGLAGADPEAVEMVDSFHRNAGVLLELAARVEETSG